MTIQTGRSYLEWVSIDNVVPNPLNPRRNDAVKTEEIQGIIKSRGWEEPLTVYKRGKNYVVLAGHRRLFAARSAKLKEIPVFVTQEPKDRTEELERIGSLQSGRVNWTPMEWATFVHDRWVSQGKPKVTPFAKRMALPLSSVAEYITVIENFPRQTIEQKLSNKTYSMTGLARIQGWIERMKAERPSILADLTEDYVREVLLRKFEGGQIDSKSIRNADIIKHVTDQDLRAFILDTKMTIQSLHERYEIDGDDTTFQGLLVTVGKSHGTLKKLKAPMGNEEKRKLAARYREMAEMLQTRAKDFERLAAQHEQREYAKQ